MTCGADSGIPVGVELEVNEILSTENGDASTSSVYGKTYEEYVAYTEDALGMEKGSAGYIRLFDIKIVDKDDHNVKYQPKEGTTVDVRIELADAEDGKDLSVVHFADGEEVGEKVEKVETDGQSVSFVAEGFSIYAITNGDSDNARIGYRFWYNDGTQDVLLATQYFRYKDVHPDNSEDALSLHEPGLPGVDSTTWARIFEGWSKTSTSDDAANLVTIEQLNTELSGKSETDFVEGTLIDVYANLKNVYYVTYVDINPNNVLATEIVPVADSGNTTFNIKSGSELRPTINSDTVLIGWYDIENPSIVYAPGQEDVVVSSNTTLYPKVDGGYWLVFDDNDLVDDGNGNMISGGASFTPPAFYFGEATIAPEDPEWDGYEFGGWYTDAACTTPFAFGEVLTHDTTVYAKWTPSASKYRVIIWKQRKTDPVDVDDNEKTYDYYNSYLISDNVTTGQTVALNNYYKMLYGSSFGDDNDETGERKAGFHYNANLSDQSVVVKADGSSVLNVYYDRNAYTLRFYFARRSKNNTTYYTTSGSNPVSDYTQIGSFTSRGNSLSNLCNADTIESVENGNYIYYYYPITALYGADISQIWPKYNLFPYSSGGNNPTRVTSFTLMVGAKAIVGDGTGGQGTIKGMITTMNEQVLGKLNDQTGNFLWIRFGTGNNWVYNIWQEQLPDTDYSNYSLTYVDHNGNTQNIGPASAVKSKNGVNYYLKDVVLVRSGSTSQHAPAYNGFTKISEDQNNSRYIMDYYYKRKDYTLTFYTNNGTNQLLEKTVPYEKVLSEYENESPGQKTGYYFLGWYVDPSFTEPFDFTQTMPDANVVIYGQWKLRRVRVVVVPGANNVYMGSQVPSFRVNYDETIDGGLMESAQRAGYILDGWYTDPEFTNRFLFSNPINDDIEDVDWTYQEDHWRATRIAYGDDDEDHENVRGILHLYAKWIPDTTSTGINVVYDPGDAAVYDSLGNLVTTVPVDPQMYGFDGTATARVAPSNYSNLYEFAYWEATLKDGTTLRILPSNPVELANLLPQDIVYDENEEELRHTVVLKAVYELVGDPARQTTITYDGNTFIETMYNGSEKTLQGKSTDGTQRLSYTLDIEVNQTIELPSAEDFYLDGYELVGWSFTEGTYAQQVSGATSDAPNFEPGQKVAADNLTISTLNDVGNTLYAMWQPKTYTVTVKQVVESGVPTNNFTYVYKRGQESGIASAQAQNKILTGNSSFTETDFGYYERIGDVIRITTPAILDTANYDVRVNAVVTRDDGTTEILNPTVAGDYQILGDVVITYTYSPKALVKLQKRDATSHSTVLTGAEFVLTPVELNSTGQWVNAGDGRTLTVNSETLEQYLQEGTYKISENASPENYAKIPSDLYLTVHKEGAFSLFTANGSAVNDSIAELTGEGADEDRLLTVYDNPIRTVTLSKTVEGGGTDSFSFKVTVFDNDGGRLRNYVVGTAGGSDLTTNNIGEVSVSLSDGQHVDLKIPHGFQLTVEETEDPRYEVSYVWDGANAVDSRIFGNEPVTITENGTLAFTNRASSQKLRIHKIGNDAADGLAGATFSLTAASGTNIAGFTNKTGLASMNNTTKLGYLPSDETDDTLFTLPMGTYTLTETEAPQYYDGIEGPMTLSVTGDGISISSVGDDSETPFDDVEISGPDGDGVYTLTVSNTRKKATVTVVKDVTGTDADKDAQYSFTATGLTESADTFQLCGRQLPETLTEGQTQTQVNTRVYTEVPYGTVFSIAEDDTYTDFDTAIVISNNGSESNVDGIATGDVTVEGDVTITYTNTKKTQPVKILKVNEGSTALANAVFSLYTGEEYAKDESERTAMQSNLSSGDGTTISLGEIDLGEIAVGKYYLVETEAPAGYILLERPVIITVESTRVYATLGSDSTAANIAEWDTTDEYWKITVHNNPGVSLPNTGGPGTNFIYLLGTILMALAGAGLVMRKRRRDEA